MESIAEIKKRIDIVEFAERLGVEVLPNRKGAKCFNKQMHKHGDKNPSLHFKIKPNGEGFYKCFACDISGSIVDLLAEFKGITITEAVREIKDGYSNSNTTQKTITQGNKLPTVKESLTEVKKADKKTREIYKALVEISQSKGISKRVMDYLTGETRGLTEETIERFSLFAMESPDYISKELQKYYSLEELVKAGLFAKGSGGYYFRFKGYEVGIPYLEGEDIIYIKARTLDKNKTPKYMQVSGFSLPLYNKDVLLTGKTPVYICEGEFDTIITAQNGYVAVGVVGINGLKEEILKDLKGLDVILAFDNDTAGQRAVGGVLGRLNNAGVYTVGQIDLPPGIKDLTDYFTFKT